MPQSSTALTHLDLQAIAGRLRQAMTAVRLDGKGFSASVGVPYSTMRNYLGGGRPPSPELLAACFRAHRISPAWLLTGALPMLAGGDTYGLNAGPSVRFTGDAPGHALAYIADEPMAAWHLAAVAETPDTMHMRGAPRAAAGPMASAGALLPHTGAKAVRPLVLSLPVGEGGGHQEKIEYQVIPRHMRPASAGAGTAALTGRDVVDLAGEVAFSFDWLRRNLGSTVGPLTTMQVDGDSMASTLLHGETIVIDEGITEVGSEGIYVLQIFSRRLVKRVQRLHDGSLILISDNTAYQSETLARDAARNVAVVGRLVCPLGR